MKTKIYLLFLILLGIAFKANCQFNFNTFPPWHSIGQTDSTVAGIGIGT